MDIDRLVVTHVDGVGVDSLSLFSCPFIMCIFNSYIDLSCIVLFLVSIILGFRIQITVLEFFYV